MDVVYNGDPARGEKELAPLRAVATPVVADSNRAQRGSAPLLRSGRGGASRWWPGEWADPRALPAPDRTRPATAGDPNSLPAARSGMHIRIKQVCARLRRLPEEAACASGLQDA